MLVEALADGASPAALAEESPLFLSFRLAVNYCGWPNSSLICMASTWNFALSNAGSTEDDTYPTISFQLAIGGRAVTQNLDSVSNLLYGRKKCKLWYLQRVS